MKRKYDPLPKAYLYQIDVATRKSYIGGSAKETTDKWAGILFSLAIGAMVGIFMIKSFLP